MINKQVREFILDILKRPGQDIFGNAVSQVSRMVKQELVVCLYATDKYSQYEQINNCLYRLNKTKYNKYRVPGTYTDFYELIPDTFYSIQINKKNWLFVNQTEKFFDNSIETVKTVTVYFVGKDRMKYRNKFITKAFSCRTDTIPATCLSKYNFMMNISPHNFSNIILEPDKKSKIVQGLRNWSYKKDWYKEHQLVYKIGVLLYGKPGAGKSTIAKAIANMFDNCPIITVQPDRVFDVPSELKYYQNTTEKPIIVLYEDIDMIFPKRDYDKGCYNNIDDDGIDEDIRKTDRKLLEQQQMLLQLLDGIWSVDNVIFIATTNYFDKLDSALIRPGRFDIQVEVDWFTREYAIQFVGMFGLTEEDLDSFGISYPIQPSYLQGLIMEHEASHMSETIVNTGKEDNTQRLADNEMMENNGYIRRKGRNYIGKAIKGRRGHR